MPDISRGGNRWAVSGWMSEPGSFWQAGQAANIAIPEGLRGKLLSIKFRAFVKFCGERALGMGANPTTVEISEHIGIVDVGDPGYAGNLGREAGGRIPLIRATHDGSTFGVVDTAPGWKTNVIGLGDGLPAMLHAASDEIRLYHPRGSTDPTDGGAQSHPTHYWTINISGTQDNANHNSVGADESEDIWLEATFEELKFGEHWLR